MNFGGRGGMGNMNQMLKQAQAMQAKMMKAQEELKEARVEGSAGGGMVSATVNGKHEVLNLTIKPEAVDPDDVEMLQDTIIAAVNEAMRNADSDASNNMSRLTGGLNLSGLF